MKRRYHLPRSADFPTLFKRGRRFESSLFRLVLRLNNKEHVRLALVVPKAVAKHAVTRNTLRRRAREWIDKRSEILSLPADIAVLFKNGAANASRSKFYEELEKLFTSIT